MVSMSEPPLPDRLWQRALMRIVRFRAWALGDVFTAGSQAVVASRDGRMLLVRPRYREGWGLVSGYLKFGEQPADAMKRELREEVGLAVRLDPPRLVYVQEGRRHIEYLFVVRLDDDFEPRPKSRFEIAEAAWFTLDALPPLQLEARVALKRALDAHVLPAATPPVENRPTAFRRRDGSTGHSDTD